VAGKVYDWSSRIESYFSLAPLNEQLTTQNILLQQQVDSLGKMIYEATNDSAVALAATRQPVGNLRMIGAKVVSNTVYRADNLMTINKGSADGVAKDMGVVSGNGVVGIVYLVSSHYSIVMPILNVRSSISCTIKDRGYFGSLHWEGGRSDVAYLEDIPRHAFFRKGDKVVTNGYSSVFPSGILVGQVKEVYNSKDGLAYRLAIRLSNDFAKLRDVVVIDSSPLREQLELLHAAQDSIKVK